MDPMSSHGPEDERATAALSRGHGSGTLEPMIRPSAADRRALA